MLANAWRFWSHVVTGRQLYDLDALDMQSPQHSSPTILCHVFGFALKLTCMIDPFAPPSVEPVVPASESLVLPPEQPRVWSAITVPLLAIFVGAILAAVTLVFAIMAMGIPLHPANIVEATSKLLSQPIGIWVAVIPGQAVFLSAALLAAYLSPVPARQRLQMSRAQMPVWTWIIFAIATPSVGIIMTLLVDVLGIEWSEHLELMGELMGGKSGLHFVITAVLVGVVPGFVEEILFRGYVQSRLLQRWSPAAAIGMSAAIFALAHMDPLHLFLVFPIGLWLGIVAWRTGSIWPAVLCHMANNLLAVTLSQGEVTDGRFQTSDLILLIPCSVAMIASVYLLMRKLPDPASAESEHISTGEE